ncbi:MAG: hypothetical protein WCY05_01305 [Candidatus Omnitrophota bacterium]
MKKNISRQYFGIFNETQWQRFKPCIKTVALFLVLCVFSCGSNFFVSTNEAFAQNKIERLQIQEPPKVSSSSTQSSTSSSTNSFTGGVNAAINAASSSAKSYYNTAVDTVRTGYSAVQNTYQSYNQPLNSQATYSSQRPSYNSQSSTFSVVDPSIDPMANDLFNSGIYLNRAVEQDRNTKVVQWGATIDVNQSGRDNMAMVFGEGSIASGSQTGKNNRMVSFGQLENNYQTGNNNIMVGHNMGNNSQRGNSNYIGADSSSSVYGVRQVGFDNSVLARNSSRYSNIGQYGSNNIINNSNSILHNVAQTGIGHSISGNQFANLSNINQFGAFNKINDNFNSTFKGINQIGIGHSISGNRFADFNGINQFGAFNKMNKNIASSFTNINQYGGLNKMNNNLASNFNNIKQYGLGNSMSGNKFSSFNNINQFGAFNQMNKNIASSFTSINQYGGLNKMNNNLASNFNNIKQYGLGNSMSGNKFSSFNNINQFGAFNQMNKNIASSFKGVNQFGLNNSISGNFNSSFKYINQSGAFNQMNKNIASSFKDINQIGLGNSMSGNKFSDFNDITQLGIFNKMNNNFNSTFKGVNQIGFANSLSGNKFSNFTNINQMGAFKKIDNNFSANIKGMSDLEFLNTKIKINDTFADLGLSSLAPGLTYEQALEYRAKYGDGTNIIPLQQRPRFSSNDGISVVTFSEGELRNFGETWEGKETNDYAHPNFDKAKAQQLTSRIIAQPSNPDHAAANKAYEKYKNDMLSSEQKPISVEEWNRAQIQHYKKELTEAGVITVSAGKGVGEVAVADAVLKKGEVGHYYPGGDYSKPALVMTTEGFLFALPLFEENASVKMANVKDVVKQVADTGPSGPSGQATALIVVQDADGEPAIVATNKHVATGLNFDDKKTVSVGGNIERDAGGFKNSGSETYAIDKTLTSSDDFSIVILKGKESQPEKGFSLKEGESVRVVPFSNENVKEGSTVYAHLREMEVPQHSQQDLMVTVLNKEQVLSAWTKKEEKDVIETIINANGMFATNAPTKGGLSGSPFFKIDGQNLSADEFTHMPLAVAGIHSSARHVKDSDGNSVDVSIEVPASRIVDFMSAAMQNKIPIPGRSFPSSSSSPTSSQP